MTAWKEGYGISSSLPQNGLVRLFIRRLPPEDNEEYRWVAPPPSPRHSNNCGNCHKQIYAEWAESAHSHSATNRHFLNLFAGTDWHGKPSPDWNVLRENPLGAGVCATCHAPTYRDPTLQYDLRKVTGVAQHGVHCDYCHKIAQTSPDNRGLQFGRDGYELLRPSKGEQLFFGPLDDAVREGEMFAYSPLYKESRYCASCHEGVVFGVHVYGTYSEWLKSPARSKGQQCQTCHMTPTGKMTNIAPGKGGIERAPHTLASHNFPGRSETLLKRCLNVDVRIRREKQTVMVNVEVQATHVGHRVPTGFIDRHLILVVQARSSKKSLVPLVAGSRLSHLAGKSLSGQPGWIYGKQLSGPKGKTPVPFWVPHGDMKDTRLFPEQVDSQQFIFDNTTHEIQVRLLYRRFWQEIAASKQWPDNELVVIDRTMKVSS